MNTLLRFVCLHTRFCLLQASQGSRMQEVIAAVWFYEVICEGL